MVRKERLQMPARRGIDIAVEMPHRAAGPRTCPPANKLRAAQLGVDCGDRTPWDEVAAADCAARVSDVLNRLGYGFDVIPSGRSVLKRA
jgi:hypothetical protein